MDRLDGVVAARYAHLDAIYYRTAASVTDGRSLRRSVDGRTVHELSEPELELLPLRPPGSLLRNPVRFRRYLTLLSARSLFLYRTQRYDVT